MASPTPPSPRRRPLVLIGLGALVVAAGLGWAWHWYTAPAVPDIPLAGADAAVKDAVGKARDEVRRQPRSAEAWGQLGMVLTANHMPEQAQQPFAQAAALAPDDERWPYLRGVALLPFHPSSALAPLRRAAELCQSDAPHQAAAHLRLAEALLVEGLHDEAETHFRRVLAVAPEQPCAEYGLGIVAQARGDLPACRAHLERCVNSPLTRQRAYAQLAAVCKRLGAEDSALAFARAAQQAPADVPWPDPYQAKSLALAVGRKKLEARIDALEQAGDMARALPLARELVRDYPDALSYLALGSVLGQVGQFEESEAVLRKALELEPRLGRAHHFLGLALFAQAERLGGRAGKKAESQALYRESARAARRAVELNDGYAEAHFQLGLALTCLEDRAGAIQAFRRAVAARPELPEPHLWLGKALAEDRQLDEARLSLENAARLAPAGDRRAREALARLGTGTKPAGP